MVSALNKVKKLILSIPPNNLELISLRFLLTKLYHIHKFNLVIIVRIE